MIGAYEFSRWFHVLIMGYWFGSECVLQAWSWHFVRAHDLTYTQRRESWDRLLDADQHVRNALILIMPFGFTLAAQLGVSPITGSRLWVVWAVSVVWFAIMWTSHLTLKMPSGRLWREIDYWLRIAVAVLFLAVGIGSLLNGEPFGARWLAAKLVLYALIIFCGAVVRVYLRRIYAVFPAYAQAGHSNPEIEREIRIGIFGGTAALYVLWVFAFVAGYLGAAKPF